MLTLVTIALLGIATPPNEGTDTRPATTASAAEEGSAVREQPAPPSAADSVVAAAFGKNIDTTPKDLKEKVPPEAATVPAAGMDWTNFVAPALALLGLGALAFGLSRRRAAAGGNLRIVETASLGPKRSLVVADVMGERMVLAVSEAGVTVLTTKPAPVPAPQFNEPAPLVVPDEFRPVTRGFPKMGFFARMFGKAPAPQRFDDLLGESIEDQELRAKLAAGFKGYVP
jgi:flagellar biogenesis protein FliO